MQRHDPASRHQGPAREPLSAMSAGDSGGVSAALVEYHGLRRGGHRPNRAEFLARHAAIAETLGECLDGLEIVLGAEENFAESHSGEESGEILGPATCLGDFRIVREVGRGGMGVVYEALQTSLGRRVALKVLPTTPALDPRQRQRFQVEAQAAALLHHEHIVPVYGVGCDRGVHYYAMQFIDGCSLADVIRGVCPPGDSEPPATEPCDSRTSSVTPSRQNVRAAARYAVQAALGLEHAHAVGVIHRDIKPSNLLVDKRGHLWITDFGLARIAQGDVGLTRTGDLLGTLRYMSPEQVRGDRDAVDSRADIYALGVTLYELLTSRPFFDANERPELFDHILHDEPAAPRRLNAAIPRDLETIVLKAVAKEPSGRYRSARELADDLQRHLDDQPIRARRPGPIECVAKWSRRHRSTVVTAAAVLLCTLSLCTALLWQSKRRTDAALESTRLANRQADAALKLQRQALTQGNLAFQLSFSAISQMTASLTARSRGAAADEHESEAVFHQAIAYYDRVGQMFPENAVMAEVVAKAARGAGNLRLALGEPRGRNDYRRAIHIYSDIAGKKPDYIWLRTGLIETLQEYAAHLEALGDAAAATGSVRRALHIAEGLLGNKSASIPCFSKGLVGPFHDLAWGLVRQPSVERADADLAARLARQTVAWAPERADLWTTVGVAEYRAGDCAAAREALDKSMVLSQGGGPRDWLFLAMLCQRRGETDQARHWYDRAVAQLKRGPAADSDLRRFQTEASRALGLPAAVTAAAF